METIDETRYELVSRDIEITRQDMEKGIPNSCRGCAIVVATNKRLPEGYYSEVDEGKLLIYQRNKETLYGYGAIHREQVVYMTHLPAPARRFVRAYDIRPEVVALMGIPLPEPFTMPTILPAYLWKGEA